MQRVGPGLELINSIISEVKARDTLFDTADNLRDVVDSYVDLIKRFLSAVPDSKMLSSPGTPQTFNSSSVIIYSLIYCVLAAEKKRVRCGMTACIAFTLMSMYCPMAQTRIGDRGGLYFIYNFCFDKDYISNVLLAQWGACCVMVRFPLRISSHCCPHPNPPLVCVVAHIRTSTQQRRSISTRWD